MSTTLPPQAAAQLEQFEHNLKENNGTIPSSNPSSTGTATPTPTTVKTEIPVRNGVSSGLKKYLPKVPTTNLITIAIVTLIGVIAVCLSFVAGSEVQRTQAVTETAAAVANIKSTMMKPSPLAVTFKQGGVEGYGFIRNFFWRTADKDYAIAATLHTAEDGSRTLENTSVKVTSDGETFQLKTGTSDTWILLVSPETPKGGQPPVTASK